MFATSRSAPAVAVPTLVKTYCMLLILVGSAAGCAGTPVSGANCVTLDCIMENARQDVARGCVNDLRRYERRKAKAIDALYRYPLTNYDSYLNFVKLGGRGPSPLDWCADYATRKVQPRYMALSAFRSSKQ